MVGENPLGFEDPLAIPAMDAQPAQDVAPEADAVDPMILKAMDQAAAQIEAEKTQEVQQQTADRGILGQAADVVDALGGGVARGLYEVKDLVVGEPNYEDKSEFRKADEAHIADINRRSVLNPIATSVGQFLFGLAATPSGKIKAVEQSGKAARFGFEAARGAIIGSAVFDPQEERLSNLVEQFPSLSNPVSVYLAADPDDSDAEGRFKNALEGIGMDLALAGAFALGVKAFRYMRQGKPEEAAKASKQAEEALAAFQQRVTPASQSTSLNPAAARQQPAVTQQPPIVRQSGQTEGKASSGVVEGAEPKPPTAQPVPQEAAGDLAQGSMRERFAKGPQSHVEPAPRPAEGTLGPAQQAALRGRQAPQDGVVIRQGAATSEDLKPAALRKPAELPDQTVEKLVELADTGRRMAAYGDPEEFRGVSPGGYINWTKVGGAQDVQAYQQAVAQAIEPRLRKIAGDVVSDKAVNAMVQARAAAFDEDPAAVVAMIRQQGKNAKQMVADMEAGYAVASGIMQDVHKLASQIKLGMLDEFGGDREAAKAALMQRMAIGAEVLGGARSMTASAGRSLRRMRKDYKLTPEVIAGFSGNTDALVEAIYHSKGDPKLLSRVMNPTYWQRFEDIFSHLITNGPLWWWPTHVVNGISNAYLLAARPTERVLGSLFLGSAGKAVRRQALKEYRSTVSHAADGWEAAKTAWMTGDSQLVPHDGVLGDLGVSANAIPWKPVNDMADVAHNALIFLNWRTATGIPTRTLGAVDEAVKTIRYRAVVQAKAAADAEDLGITGQAAETYIAQRLNDSFDEMGRAIDPSALREAQATTFQTPLRKGTLGFGIQNMVQNQPLLRAIFTYVRTPINVLRYGIRMTPGLQYAQQEFREMLNSPDPFVRAQARGQQALGMLWIGAVAPFVVSGQVTGGGPSDPKLRGELTAQGWRPYSYVMESEDGTKRYIPLGRFDPPGLLIGMMADLWDMSEHPEVYGLKDTEAAYERISNGMQAVSIALLKNIMNKTYLMQLDSTVRALREPDKQFGRFAGNIVENTIPFAAALRGSNPDEYSREARTIVDNIIDTMPGLSKTLEPRYDALSDPILVQRGLWSKSTHTGDKVREELQRIILETGKGLSPVTPTRDSQVDLRDFQLKDGRSAYSRLNEYVARPKGMKPLADALDALMARKEYRAAPDGEGDAKGTKLWMIQTVVSKYREAAYKRLISENPDLFEAIKANQRKAAAAYDKSRTSAPVDRSLNALGVK